MAVSAGLAADGSWNVDGSGTWSTATNWNSNPVVPGTASTDIIGLNNNITSNVTVTIDTTSRTLGTLNIGDSNNSNTFTLAASGGGDLTISGTINEAGALSDTIATPVILGSGITTNVTGSLVISGNVSGAQAFAKTGSGTLLLSGANAYGGGTTISAGTVAISNATSLGTGNVSVTGGSRINVSANVMYANNINVGAALSLQNPQPAGGGNATYGGVLSGSSAITVVNGGGSAVLAGHVFTNTGNTFTGNVTMPSGNVVGDDRFSFASIGDGGTLTLQKAGNQNAIIYTGASDIAFNSRSITVGTGFGGGAVDGGGVTPINRFMNIGTGTVTFNATMGMTTIASNGTLFFDGSNAESNTYAGTIANPTSGGNLGIGKNGTGKWILTGSNGFDGEVLVHQGILSVNSVAAASSTNQPLGNNAIVQVGFRNNGSATLEVTASGTSSTDKRIRIGSGLAAGTGGGIILNNGAGSLAFTNTSFNPTVAGITATRSLTLGGNFTGGANEIQGVIQNNNTAGGGLVAVTVSGSTWSLAGNNTYTGATNVNAGTLLVNGNQAAATGATTVASLARLGGNGTLGGALIANGSIAPGNSIGTLSVSGNVTWNGSTGNEWVYELGPANTSDLLSITGNFTRGTGSVFEFDFAGSTATGNFTLVSWMGSSTFTVGNFTYTNLAGGNTGTFNLTGSQLQFVVVPEPSAVVTLGTSLAFFGLFIARQRRLRDPSLFR